MAAAPPPPLRCFPALTGGLGQRPQAPAAGGGAGSPGGAARSPTQRGWELVSGARPGQSAPSVACRGGAGQRSAAQRPGTVGARTLGGWGGVGPVSAPVRGGRWGSGAALPWELLGAVGWRGAT